MTKMEAFKAMLAGKKICNIYWEDKKLSFQIKGNMIIDNSGNSCQGAFGSWEFNDYNEWNEWNLNPWNWKVGDTIKFGALSANWVVVFVNEEVVLGRSREEEYDSCDRYETFERKHQLELRLV